MKTRGFSRFARCFGGLCCALINLLHISPARAEIQFDVFLGYEGFVREGAWFPVAVEIHNDGPSFDAVFEISPAYAGNSQARRVRVELPSNTRKRFFVPVFSSTGRMTSWNARLLDSKGKVRAERPSIRPKDVAWETPLFGAVPRTFTTAPTLPEAGPPQQAEMQPQVGRIPPDMFPDNPITLEALSALYLNSERAADLKVPQQAALLAWVHSGGHLVLAIEQPSDVNALPWLKQLIPGQLQGQSNLPMNGELEAWLRENQAMKSAEGSARAENLPKLPGRNRPRNRNPIVPATGIPSFQNPLANIAADPAFANVSLSVSHFVPEDSKTLAQSGQTPLVVSANRGAGKITVLLFSPEREPFKSWKNKPWFWAKTIDIPEASWMPQNMRYGGRSLDGVFGAMIDSRQARKLPVSWLLGILAVYLIVIGPFDHYILKKLNRQMLTWITFPLYVLTFSLLIYFIGYKLRAGETEWNELHVVDMLPRGDRAEWRGHTFASVYSPVNSEYQIAGDQPHSTVRGEYGGVWAGNQDSSKARVEQLGKGFEARIFVPVWTSQLVVSEWMQPGPMPITVTPSFDKDEGMELTLRNNLPRDLGPVRIVMQDRLYTLLRLEANATTNFVLSAGMGEPLESFVQRHSSEFMGRIENRQRALGDTQSGRINNLIDASMAACFTSAVASQNSDGRSFVYAPGFDLHRLTQRGDAVVLAWDANQGATTPLNKFSARRTQKNTLMRLVVPITAPPG